MLSVKICIAVAISCPLLLDSIALVQSCQKLRRETLKVTFATPSKKNGIQLYHISFLFSTSCSGTLFPVSRNTFKEHFTSTAELGVLFLGRRRVGDSDDSFVSLQLFDRPLDKQV